MLAVSIIRVMFGRRKMLYISLGLLFIPLSLMFVSKRIAYLALENAVVDHRVEVKVDPSPNVASKKFIRDVIDNISFNKGASGSRPTDELYKVGICVEDTCHLYVVAEDSREPKMFWVSYKTGIGIDYPLGFTKLKKYKI
jgi:hypothetical protein